MNNLEPLCAEYGHLIVSKSAPAELKDQENVVTKALGVLIENGLYAMSVFLLSCNKKEYGKTVLEKLHELWTDPRLNLIRSRNQRSPRNILEDVRTVTESLPRLILARKVTEQALTFARYHAKADIKSD